jgi:hypothetical protein
MSVDDHAYLEAIADAIREETCVLFLGAGVHAPPPAGSSFNYVEDVRPPLASALSERLARGSGFDRRFRNESPTDLTRVALFFEHLQGRGRLEDDIRRAVQEGKEPSPILRALAELGFPIVITTNYDQLFETALAAAGRDHSVFVYGVDFGSGHRSLRGAGHGGERDHYQRLSTAYERFHNATAASPVVLKAHGDIGHFGTIVVTDEDYIRIANQIGIVAEYVKLAASETRGWTALIVGYRMLDFDFRQIFTLYTEAEAAWWRSSRYAVDPAPDELLSEIWERERGVEYIRSNVWCFVPDLLPARSRQGDAELTARKRSSSDRYWELTATSDISRGGSSARHCRQS